MDQGYGTQEMENAIFKDKNRKGFFIRKLLVLRVDLSFFNNVS